jgi:hypothetical protein
MRSARGRARVLGRRPAGSGFEQIDAESVRPALGHSSRQTGLSGGRADGGIGERRPSEGWRGCFVQPERIFKLSGDGDERGLVPGGSEQLRADW